MSKIKTAVRELICLCSSGFLDNISKVLATVITLPEHCHFLAMLLTLVVNKRDHTKINIITFLISPLFVCFLLFSVV